MAEQNDFGPRYKVADLFCGAGGLSLGFSMTRRFDAVYGADLKPEAVETFRVNHKTATGGEPAVELEDVKSLGVRGVLSKMARFGVRKPGDLDCLIGGPPCEGFSQNRTIRDGARAHKFIDDDRNDLFRWFVSLAGELRPKVVLIENVPDLIRHRGGETLAEIFQALNQAGYTTEARVLNAADFGVPQMRRRAFFLAQRTDDLQRLNLRLHFPNPTHRPYPMMHATLRDREDWLPGDSGYWVTVREAIGDLPAAFDREGYADEDGEYAEGPVTGFRALMRKWKGIPRNHVRRKLGPGGLMRLQALKQGQACSDLPDHLRPKGYYHYSYSRLSWSEPARTITKFVYHVGSGQFGHPVEDRAVTIREAARLQSFPDEFVFAGTSEIRQLSALVGSAVPPLLGRAIAQQVALYLDALYLAAMEPGARAEASTLKGDAVLRRMHKEVWTTEDERARQMPLPT